MEQLHSVILFIITFLSNIFGFYLFLFFFSPFLMILSTSLAFNDIGDEGASAFASLIEKNYTLTSLEFVLPFIGIFLLILIVHHNNSVSGNKMKEKGIEELLSSLVYNPMTSLEFRFFLFCGYHRFIPHHVLFFFLF